MLIGWETSFGITVKLFNARMNDRICATRTIKVPSRSELEVMVKLEVPLEEICLLQGAKDKHM